MKQINKKVIFKPNLTLNKKNQKTCFIYNFKLYNTILYYSSLIKLTNI